MLTKAGEMQYAIAAVDRSITFGWGMAFFFLFFFQVFLFLVFFFCKLFFFSLKYSMRSRERVLQRVVKPLFVGRRFGALAN